MNIHRLGLLQYALLLATAALILVFLQTRRLDLAQHNHRLDLLLQLQQTEAQLDRNVFEMAAFQLRQYDPFIPVSRRIRTLLQQLADLETIEGKTSTLNREIEAYRHAFSDKFALIERLKSTTAQMRNQLHYLPVAAKSLSDARPKLNQSMAHLLNELYQYNLLPSDQERQELIQKLDALEASSDLDGTARKALDQLLLHMRANLHLMEKLAALRARYTAVPTDTHFTQLYQNYSKCYEAQTRIAGYFSTLLLIAALLLLIGLGVALRKIYQAQRAVKAAHDQLQNAVENLSEAFALFGSDGRLILHNRQYAAFYPWLQTILSTGTHLSDILECQAAQEIHLWDLKNRPIPPFKGRLPCRKDRTYQEELPDGRWYLASNTCTPAGELICVRVDISESKHFEIELRKLYRALEQSPAAVLITDFDGNIEYVNPKFEETTGYTAAEAVGQNPRILKSGDKSPEEYKELWDTIKSGRTWRGQFHNKRKDGKIYWESASISPVRDESGKITHFIAVKEDITARKRAEEQLRMNATVFETTNEGIMVTDESNRIVTVNPAFTRITGYEPEEVIGRKPSVLSSGRHDRAFYQEMWESLKKRGFWSGEIWNRRKDGSVYPEWLSIAAIHDSDHPHQEYVAIFSDITRRKQDEAQIERQANFDALTDLPNRSLFADRLAHSLTSARREHWLVALLFIDLDHFKSINDTLGHVVGDQLLQQVAQRLRNCVRESDTVARFGGDEFVILLDDIKKASTAAKTAKKIITALQTPFELNGHEGYIGASIGITLFPADGQDGNTLLRNADMAMYRAKDAGRNNYQFFTASMNQQMRDRAALEQDLRLALKRGQLFLRYQPIVDFKAGRITGVEVLLRWHHPERGLVSPNRFIPLAEDMGLIGPMGTWVLERACTQAARWQEEGLDLHININLSSRQLALGLTPTYIADLLKKQGFSPNHLVLEITESLMLDRNAASLNWIRALKELGVRFAVDDFGTGYSSLSYLKRFPIDILKIDRSFVQDLPEEQHDVSLVKAILALAHSFGLEVVAEGIETPAQLQFLRKIGCRKGQGYLFSPPLSPEEIHPLFEQGMGKYLTDRPQPVQPQALPFIEKASGTQPDREDTPQPGGGGDQEHD